MAVPWDKSVLRSTCVPLSRQIASPIVRQPSWHVRLDILHNTYLQRCCLHCQKGSRHCTRSCYEQHSSLFQKRLFRSIVAFLTDRCFQQKAWSLWMLSSSTFRIEPDDLIRSGESSDEDWSWSSLAPILPFKKTNFEARAMQRTQLWTNKGYEIICILQASILSMQTWQQWSNPKWDE